MLQKYNANITGITNNSVLGIHIIIGVNGMNMDVISHELAHSELFFRVGWLKSFKIPLWFNEGLATQVDYRPNYSLSAWNAITNNGSDIPDVTILNKPKEFYHSKYSKPSMISR